jgi:peptidoglycan hydrolase-like protein with peptidoglycan-binding domain
MHIQCNSSPAELAALKLPGRPPTRRPPTPGIHPYPLPPGCYFGPLYGPTESISGIPTSDWAWRPALKVAQSRLHVVVDGMYGPVTQTAVRRWQATHRLVVDGLIGPNTWRSLMS